jgi:hypothetical protein
LAPNNFEIAGRLVVARIEPDGLFVVDDGTVEIALAL